MYLSCSLSMDANILVLALGHKYMDTWAAGQVHGHLSMDTWAVGQVPMYLSSQVHRHLSMDTWAVEQVPMYLSMGTCPWTLASWITITAILDVKCIYARETVGCGLPWISFWHVWLRSPCIPLHTQIYLYRWRAVNFAHFLIYFVYNCDEVHYLRYPTHELVHGLQYMWLIVCVQLNHILVNTNCGWRLDIPLTSIHVQFRWELSEL